MLLGGHIASSLQALCVVRELLFSILCKTGHSGICSVIGIDSLAMGYGVSRRAATHSLDSNLGLTQFRSSEG